VEHSEQGAYPSQAEEQAATQEPVAPNGEQEMTQTEINELKARLESLEGIVADVIARNCLLMGSHLSIKSVMPLLEAGQSDSVEDKA